MTDQILGTMDIDEDQENVTEVVGQGADPEADHEKEGIFHSFIWYGLSSLLINFFPSYSQVQQESS